MGVSLLGETLNCVPLFARDGRGLIENLLA